MKKSLLWIIVLVLSISMISVFSFAGCKKAEEAAAPAEEEVAEEAAEEPAAEEEAAEESEKMTINYWYWAGSEHTWEEKVFNRYMELHPNIEIVGNVQDQYTIKDIIAPALSSQDRTIDFSRYYSGSWVRPLIDAGYVMDLGPYAEKYGWLDRFSAPMKASSQGTYGKYYQLYIAFLVFPVSYYNKDIFEEVGVTPPTTMDELLDVSNKIRDAGYESMVVGYATKWPLQHITEQLLLTHLGPEKLMELLHSTDKDYDGSMSWTDPEVVEVYEAVKWLSDSGIVSERSSSLDIDMARAAFMNKETAMFSYGSWDLIQLGLDAPDINYDYLLWPPIEADEPHTQMSSLAVGYIIPTYSEGEKADAIAEIFDFMLQPEQQLLGIEMGLPPMVNDIPEEQLSAVADPKFIRLMKDIDTYGTGVYHQDDWLSMEFIELQEDKLVEMVTGVTSPEDAAAAIEGIAEEIRNR